MLPGERRLAWLGIKSHLFLAAWWVFLWNFDIFKPGCDPARTDHTNTPEEHEENVQEKKKKKKEKEKYDEKSFMWLTACVLFCHTGAVQGGGRGKMHFLFPSIN